MYALKTAVYLLNRIPSKAVPKTPFELWTIRKPSLRHLHVWGCLAEARVYNPHEMKLDSRTVSGYFIGYPEKSKGYRFYCPKHSSRIVETGNAKFIENGEVSGSANKQIVDINKIRDNVSLPINISTSTIVPKVVPELQEQNNGEQHLNEEAPHEEPNPPQIDINEPRGIALNKPVRVRRSTISDDYVVYLQEPDYDCGIDNDPIYFSQAINNDKSDKWIDAMKEELKSMTQNNVCDLVELLEGSKRVGC